MREGLRRGLREALHIARRGPENRFAAYRSDREEEGHWRAGRGERARRVEDVGVGIDPKNLALVGGRRRQTLHPLMLQFVRSMTVCCAMREETSSSCR